jgi:SAM-dependent methyltransferase
MTRDPDRDGATELAGHPDRLRWNARYCDGFVPSFAPHPLAVQLLDLALPPGPVLELACGPSGSALCWAAAGRTVTAVDISDVALGMLTAEALRRGLAHLIRPLQADLGALRPEAAVYAAVLSTAYWDRGVFAVAAAAVAPGGLLGWEALTGGARRHRPGLPSQWCVTGGQPASLLPAGFQVIEQRDIVSDRSARRRLLARRAADGASVLTPGGPRPATPAP